MLLFGLSHLLTAVESDQRFTTINQAQGLDAAVVAVSVSSPAQAHHISAGPKTKEHK